MSRNEKVFTYLGFCIKSGNILFGYESVLAAKKRTYLILLGEDLSENSRKKVLRFGEEKNIQTITIVALPDYFGGRRIKCVGICEEHLALAIGKELYNTVGGSN